MFADYVRAIRSLHHLLVCFWFPESDLKNGGSSNSIWSTAFDRA